MKLREPLLLGVAVLACTACAPDFEDRPYLLDHSRLVAVIADPAEARPNEAVTLTPVVAWPSNDGPVPSFHFCLAPPAPADPRPVAESCLDEAGPTLEPSGNGALGTIPADACARFGPDPADGELRPVDPDTTGGFYQPVAISGLPEAAVARVRIRCALPDVAPDVARTFAEQYVPNQNPELLTIAVLVDGVATSDASLFAARPNRLRVYWTEASNETYALLGPNGTTIDQHAESLRVSWFTTSGRLESSATAPEGVAGSTTSLNTFTPELGDSEAHFWVVLQDSRGGSAARHWRLPVAAP